MFYVANGVFDLLSVLNTLVLDAACPATRPPTRYPIIHRVGADLTEGFRSITADPVAAFSPHGRAMSGAIRLRSRRGG